MIMYCVSIPVAIRSMALHHLSHRLTPRGVEPHISLVLTYSVVVVLTAFPRYFRRAMRGIVVELRRPKSASALLALSIVGLDIGFLLLYRSGWDIGRAAFLENVAAGLILVPVALLAFKDKLNRINIAGVVTCLDDLVMLKWKR